MRVIAIDFRQTPAALRLARSFSRLTGIPLARLLADETAGRERWVSTS